MANGDKKLPWGSTTVSAVLATGIALGANYQFSSVRSDAFTGTQGKALNAAVTSLANELAGVKEELEEAEEDINRLETSVLGLPPRNLIRTVDQHEHRISELEKTCEWFEKYFHGNQRNSFLIGPVEE